MFQPQRYRKEEERKKKKRKKGGKKRKLFIFFFPFRHLIYSVTLMLINNA